MCGILVAASCGGVVDEGAMRRGLAAIKHRGPDGEGLWMSADRRVALGHRRLAVVDLKTGAQPLSNEDGTIHAVVNGEIYGFEELRAQLEGRGHRFKTRSDSEVLVHLYEDRGVDCVALLRGELAFVLYDERQRLLLAGRDRFGVKPLCYAHQGELLALASEAKALFALSVAAAWDEPSFHFASALQYLPPERTMFRGVHALPPGHVLVHVDGRVHVRPYWDLDLARDDAISTMDGNEAVIRVRASLEDAVRVRLRGDVPVCFQLSGGLDSSAVVALARPHIAGTLECFSVSFPGTSYDEDVLSQHMARHVGAQRHSVIVTPDDIVRHVSDATFFAEGLAINGHLVGKLLLDRAIRDAGLKVVLTGEGADEVFAGYAHLRRDLFLNDARAGDARAADRLLRLHATNQASSGIMLPAGVGPALASVERMLGFVPSFLQAKAELGARVRSLLRDDVIQGERDQAALLLTGFDVARQLTGRHPVHQSLYLWCKLALAGYLLKTLGDGMEMASSVEGRLPFLDSQLFDVVRALPLDMKIRDGVEKHVLREAMAPLLPPRIAQREKQPFLAPPLFGGWQAREQLRDIVHSAAFAAMPFYDARKVRALIDGQHALEERERALWDPALMFVLTSWALHERFHL